MDPADANGDAEIVADDRFTLAFRGTSIALHPAQRRVRAEFNGMIVADSYRPYLFIEFRDPRERAADIEDNRYWMGRCLYYWPIKDITSAAFVSCGQRREDPRLGTATYYNLQVRDRVMERAAWVWDRPSTPDGLRLQEYMGIHSIALDAMFEEEDEIYAPRNPYHSVEVRTSARHVQIEVDGIIVADSRQTRMLFETGLPIRYYFPRAHVHMALLDRTELRTGCPYKGESIYWTVQGGSVPRENIAWSYVHPYPNAGKIEHLIAFYEERGAVVIVDGVRQPSPGSPFPPGFITKPIGRKSGGNP